MRNATCWLNTRPRNWRSWMRNTAWSWRSGEKSSDPGRRYCTAKRRLPSSTFQSQDDCSAYFHKCESQVWLQAFAGQILESLALIYLSCVETCADLHGSFRTRGPGTKRQETENIYFNKSQKTTHEFPWRKQVVFYQVKQKRFTIKQMYLFYSMIFVFVRNMLLSVHNDQSEVSLVFILQFFKDLFASRIHTDSKFRTRVQTWHETWAAPTLTSRLINVEPCVKMAVRRFLPYVQFISEGSCVYFV